MALDSSYIITIKLLKKFLEKKGCRIDIITIQNIYRKHPLPHSIRALSDTLDALHIPNIVCCISPAQLNDVPTPAIVFLRNSQNLFYLFNGINKENKIVLQSTTNTFVINIENFCKSWSGDILLAEKEENIKYISKFIYALREVFWFISQPAIWWILCLLVVIILWNVCINNFLSFTIYEKIICVVNLLGLAISTIIIIKTYWDSSLMQNVCMVNNLDKCKNIFRTNEAFLFGLLPLGILAWAYFLTMIVWGIFITKDPLPGWMLYSSLSLGFVFYSIIWQWMKSTGCLWCFLLDALLILEFIILIYSGDSLFQRLSFYPDLLTWVALYLLIFLSTYKGCTLLSATTQWNTLIEKNERLLSSNEILPYMLSISPIILTSDFDKIYSINNMKHSEYRITAILNLRCSHCGKAHKIISTIKDCRIDYLMITNEKDAKAIQAAKQFITISLLENGGWEKVNAAMSMWYQKGYLEHFVEETQNAVEILKAQNEYCYKIGVKITPEILINGRRLPEIYDITDLEYIL
ncbi:MAG: cysteine peptidase family C39 domain-containing protein [Bacteroidales bacterium]